MFNKIVLVGNLTRDIELRYISSGTALSKTAIATTRKFTVNGERREEVCFVDVTFFGRSAEIANQYLKKGSKCLIEGRLMFEQWVDQSGQKRSKHSVTVESMQMLDSKSDTQNMSNYSNAPAPKQDQKIAPSFNGSESYNKAQEKNNFSQEKQQEVPQSEKHAQPNYQPQTAIPEYDIDEDEIPF